jgi:hypothetical protein
LVLPKNSGGKVRLGVPNRQPVEHPSPGDIDVMALKVDANKPTPFKDGSASGTPGTRKGVQHQTARWGH